MEKESERSSGLFISCTGFPVCISTVTDAVLVGLSCDTNSLAGEGGSWVNGGDTLWDVNDDDEGEEEEDEEEVEELVNPWTAVAAIPGARFNKSSVCHLTEFARAVISGICISE